MEFRFSPAPDPDVQNVSEEVAAVLYQRVMRFLEMERPRTLSQMMQMCLALGATVVWLNGYADGFAGDWGQYEVWKTCLCIVDNPDLTDHERSQVLAHALCVYLMRHNPVAARLVRHLCARKRKRVADAFVRLIVSEEGVRSRDWLTDGSREDPI